MEQITNLNEVSSLEENKVLFPEENDQITLDNTKIIFKGKNNIVFIENEVKIKDSNILFEGDNNVIYLSSNFNIYLLNVTCYNESVFYMGENNYTNGKLNAILSERKHIVIGDRGLFAFGIWMRLADPHLIFDANTGERKNVTKSIFLGDHVWVGQGAMVLKGTKMGSGSIVGAMSLVSNKTIPSNTIWGGNPVKQIAKDKFFTGDVVHRYDEEKTNWSMKCDKDLFIYKHEDGVTKSFDEIDEALSAAKTSEEKLDYVINNIRNYKQKNRFYIGE